MMFKSRCIPFTLFLYWCRSREHRHQVEVLKALMKLHGHCQQRLQHSFHLLCSSSPARRRLRAAARKGPVLAAQMVHLPLIMAQQLAA